MIFVAFTNKNVLIAQVFPYEKRNVSWVIGVLLYDWFDDTSLSRQLAFTFWVRNGAAQDREKVIQEVLSNKLCDIRCLNYRTRKRYVTTRSTPCLFKNRVPHLSILVSCEAFCKNSTIYIYRKTLTCTIEEKSSFTLGLKDYET